MRLSRSPRQNGTSVRSSFTRRALWSQRGSAPGSVISTLTRSPSPVRRLSPSRAQPVALRAGQRARRIDAHEDVVQALVAADDDLELVDLRVGPHQLLDPARVDDDAPHLLHVVEAGVYAALESHERAPAGTLPVGHTGGWSSRSRRIRDGGGEHRPVFGGPPGVMTPDGACASPR